MITLNIEISSTSVKWKKAFPRMKPKIEQAVAYTVTAAKKPAALKERTLDIDILLTTDARIKTLNRDWRATDKPTNVLSFPQLEMKTLRKSALKIYPDSIPLGDIALAFETIKRECRRDSKTLENHVIHLVVHGALHLLGYDHIHDKDAKAMEKKECDILSVLGYPSPYDDE